MDLNYLKREWKLHQLGVSEDSIIENIFKKLGKYLSNPKPYLMFRCHDDKSMKDEDREINYQCTKYGSFVMSYNPGNDFLYVDYEYVQKKVFKNSNYGDDTVKDFVLWWTKDILKMEYDLLFVRPQDRILSGPSYGRRGRHSLWWCEEML